MKKICFFFLLLNLNASSQALQVDIDKLQRRVDEQDRIIKSMQEKEDSRMVIYISVSAIALIAFTGFFLWKIRKITNAQLSEKTNTVAEVSEEKVLYKKLPDELGGRPDSAPRTIERIEKLTANECVKKGISVYDNENYQEAMKYFTQALSLNPDSSDLQSAFYYRGLSKYRLGNYLDAIKDFDSAMVTETDYLYFIRGTAYFFLDKLPEALKDMEKAIKLNPDYEDAIEYRKDILDKMGRG